MSVRMYTALTCMHHIACIHCIVLPDCLRAFFSRTHARTHTHASYIYIYLHWLWNNTFSL